MTVTILTGDCREILRTLPPDSVHCCVTSPPYFGLRDYGVAGQIGLEPTPEAFVAELVDVFREVRRVLRDDGTLWLNLGDSFCSTDKWGGGGNVGKNTVAADGSVPSWAVRARKPHMPGIKPKDLIGIPWMVAFALRSDGWYLRQDIIWSKPNPMPESVADRCTKAHEYVFLLSKNGGRALTWRHRDTRLWSEVKPEPDYVWRHKTSDKETREPQVGLEWRRINLWSGFDYFYDADAISEPVSGTAHARKAGANSRENVDRTPISKKRAPGVPPKSAERGSGIKANDSFQAAVADLVDFRNKRSVWTVASEAFSEAHFATFPPALIEPCILAGCPEGGVVLDPFGGAGTTGLVADRLKRSAVLIELNPAYAEMTRRRIHDDSPLFSSVV